MLLDTVWDCLKLLPLVPKCSEGSSSEMPGIFLGSCNLTKVLTWFCSLRRATSTATVSRRSSHRTTFFDLRFESLSTNQVRCQQIHPTRPNRAQVQCLSAPAQLAIEVPAETWMALRRCEQVRICRGARKGLRFVQLLGADLIIPDTKIKPTIGFAGCLQFVLLVLSGSLQRSDQRRNVVLKVLHADS